MAYIDLLRYATLLLGGFLLIVFLIALWKEDNGIMDIAYGLGFLVITGALFALASAHSLQQKILPVLVTLWGVRLAWRIYQKNRGKPEDFRYSAWREVWQKKSQLYFFLRSFIQIYLLQGLIILAVLSPVLVAYSQVWHTLTLLNWFGLGLWCLGFFFEAVGDWQLDRFLRKPENRGQIMTSGLWSLSRHPNYFGEASMWWGIWLFVWGLPLASSAMVSPLLITFLLLKVSGIPMLEAMWAGRPDWEEYKKKTNAFFPWRQKKV